MNFKLEKGELGVALGKIQGVISNYETTPVLKTYHFQLSPGSLVIAATDLELGTSVKIDLPDNKDSGDAAIPSKKINDIVKALDTDAKLAFNIDEDARIDIVSGKSRWRLRGILGTEFPTMPTFEDEAQLWTIKRENLIAVLDRVQGFTALENNPSVGMKAVAIQNEHIMSTNGEVLACQCHPFEVGSVSQIPASCVKDLLAVLRLSGVEELSVMQGDEFIFFEVGDDTLFTRLLDEWEFPDVAPMLERLDTSETHLNYDVSVERRYLMAALKRVKVASDEEKKEITIAFAPTKLELTSSTDEGDYASETVPCKSQSAETVPMVSASVNWVALYDAMNKMISDDVQISVQETFLRLSDHDIYLNYFVMRRDF